MILGRPANLVISAASAIVNLLILAAAAAGYTLTPELIAAINLVVLTVISLVANQPPTVNSGDTVTVQTAAGEANRQVTVQ